MIYDILAPIYDKINADIDYCAWADFIENAVRKYGTNHRPELVLDLGCGTGRMTLELARRGYDMRGFPIGCYGSLRICASSSFTVLLI